MIATQSFSDAHFYAVLQKSKHVMKNFIQA